MRILNVQEMEVVAGGDNSVGYWPPSVGPLGPDNMTDGERNYWSMTEEERARSDWMQYGDPSAMDRLLDLTATGRGSAAFQQTPNY
ncbi:hypothetical protein INH39_17680 [Massilia violaceinigra]|uniref:Uncharacterized protein n=1 Tax=Massilia violaceinigra TaxID=2045208 RepID=A0ABY3ZY24_9BURK|nr:hypothetical protein [Massilia violaceinigra]UOD27365.1 hypothetical protein INH39_17680 [Massilia violaceinigra]